MRIMTSFGDEELTPEVGIGSSWQCDSDSLQSLNRNR